MSDEELEKSLGSFFVLPRDVLFYLIGGMKVKEIGRVSCLSVAMHGMSEDDTVWKRLYEREFDNNEEKMKNKSLSISWKQYLKEYFYYLVWNPDRRNQEHIHISENGKHVKSSLSGTWLCSQVGKMNHLPTSGHFRVKIESNDPFIGIAYSARLTIVLMTRG